MVGLLLGGEHCGRDIGSEDRGDGPARGESVHRRCFAYDPLALSDGALLLVIALLPVRLVSGSLGGYCHFEIPDSQFESGFHRTSPLGQCKADARAAKIVETRVEWTRASVMRIVTPSGWSQAATGWGLVLFAGCCPSPQCLDQAAVLDMLVSWSFFSLPLWRKKS